LNHTPPPADAATRRAALIAATLVAFLTPYMGSATNLALPAMGREFGLDAVLLSWVQSAYLLAAAVFLVPFGKLADIHGRKRVFAYGTALFSLASLLVALSGSVALLLAARVLQGMGSAMIFGTGVAILTSVFPAAQRGRVLGLNVAAVYTGLSLGPTVGGLLTQNYGWRAVFLAVLPFGLLVLLFVILCLKGEWAEARGERFDWPGSLVYALVLIALMLGLSSLPEMRGAALIAASLAGFGLFAAWELRAPNPVLNLRLFAHSRTFSFSNLAALVHYSATAAVTFLLSLYLQYIQALSPQAAGWVLIAQPVVMATFSPLAGRLSDRLEPRIVASSGMALSALGLFSFIAIGPQTPLWTIILRLMLLGLGFAFFSSPNMSAIMGAVERKYYGVASGTLGTMRLLGQMLSIGIASLLFALYIGRVPITPASYPLFLQSARTAFVIYAFLCVGGIFASLARGSLRGNHNHEPT
jgi:EmrB/QacA subfamily drug resistance transporter